jgi:hypothetical protein
MPAMFTDYPRDMNPEMANLFGGHFKEYGDEKYCH